LGRRDVRDAIQSLNRDGCTIFYSSHVLSDVESISHRVAMIVDGRIVQQGTVDEVTGGENAFYRVRISHGTLNLDTLKGVRLLGHPQEYLCEGPAPRDALIRACLDAGFGVEHIENDKPSLEEVLTREVAKEGLNG